PAPAVRTRRPKRCPGSSPSPVPADARRRVCGGDGRDVVPIHDGGYRRYDGVRAKRGRAWRTIWSAGMRGLFRRRSFLALLLLAWIPFFVRVVQVYAAANLPQAAEILAIRAETFEQYLNRQSVFVFFITAFVGGGLIADDRRANALQIYLSKPLS